MNNFYKHYRNIPEVEPAKSDEGFPGPPLVSPEASQAIANAKEARDLFTIDRFIRLEATPQSIIGQINKVLFIEGNWIIFDSIQNQVLKFSEEGTFLGAVGRKGEGPGEYIQANNIVKVWGNNIAIDDGLRGRVLVFNLDGDLVFQTQRPGEPGDGGKFIITHAFVWNRKDRLYLSDFSSNAASIPQHVALDYSNSDGKLLFGFGKRYATYANWTNQKKVFRHAWTEFAEINGRLWTGNPLFAHLDIYTMEGQYLGPIRGGHIDYITRNDYESLEPSMKTIERLWLKKQRTNLLISRGNLVYQGLTAGRYHRLNAYDVNGNLLNAGLEQDFLTAHLKGATETHWVAVAEMLDKEERFVRAYGERAVEKLMEAGWRPDNFDDDNDYLCLLKNSWENEEKQ